MQPAVDETALLAKVAGQWGLDLVRWRPDLSLAGSPERTLWRQVAESGHGDLFVFEKIASRDYGRKRRIQRTLAHLQRHGLECIAPYRMDLSGEGIPLIDHGLWQLSPFVPGVELDRPHYVMDAWRGRATADFLIDLTRICADHPPPPEPQPFLVADYVRNLIAQLERHAPDTARIYRPFAAHLETALFPVIQALPTGFCHGDCHPLNIIWGSKRIRAVIDWEFCGVKPQIYDLANLLGCLGVEDPDALKGPLVQELTRRLRQSGLYGSESWKALPDLMLAIRFAWLSEWMRKSDRPMIQLEADYMALLLDHRPELKSLGT